MNKKCFQITGHIGVSYIYFDSNNIFMLGEDGTVYTFSKNNTIYSGWEELVTMSEKQIEGSYYKGLGYKEVAIESLLTHSNPNIRFWAKEINGSQS